MTAGTTVAAALLQVQDVARIIEQGQPPIKQVQTALDRVEAGKPQTLLLLGSDHRFDDEETGRQVSSDTMILVRLNPDEPATTVLSLPRDLQVEIPGHGVGKINAAFSRGGPVLAAKTVRRLLDIPIHHIFVTTFTAFSRAVDFVGCVYTDVDRRYLVPPDAGYAAIDLKAGYQRVCGDDALSFVRFRHDDDDLVRAARQQAFLRAAAQQVRVSGLISRVKDLVRLLARYTQTDVRGTKEILRLLKLAVLSADHPVVQVQFPAILPDGPEDPYVYTDQGKLDDAVDRFMHPPAAGGPARRGRSSGSSGGGAGRGGGSKSADSASSLEPAPSQADAARALRPKARMPVFHLSRLVPGTRVVTDGSPRAYSIRDPDGNRHRAYRFVFSTGKRAGDYYGLQGTAWSDPPLLEEATGTVQVRGRPAQIASSGGKLLWVAWRQGDSVHWVSNTLMRTLSTKQMLALAAAARGGR